MASLIIKQPKIVSVNNNKSRISTDIIRDGNVLPFWVEADNKYAQYMVTENCDAALCFALVLAMRRGYDIVCEAPITEILLYKLNEFAQVAYTYSSRLHLPKITAETCSVLPNKGAVVTTASFGVDSSYAIDKFLNPPYPSLKLTHLVHNDLLEFSDFRYRYMAHYKKTKEDALEISNKVKELARKKVVEFAGELGLEYCFFDTNASSFGIGSNFYITFLNAGLVTFSFAKLFGTVVVPGTYDVSHFNIKNVFYCDNTYHELLNLFSLTTADATGGIKFIPDSFCADRLDKLRSIMGNQILRKYLSVCWFTQNEKNCNTCSKCKRTLVILDYLGVLERFSESFDIEFYNKNFNESYAPYIVYGRDLKNNLHVDEKRYRELRDTVIAKHR
jgi:hypothetical protein